MALGIFFYVYHKYVKEIRDIVSDFVKKLTWYHKCIMLLFGIVIIRGLAGLINEKAFQTIIDWLKSFLIEIIASMRYLNELLHKLSKNNSSVSPIKDELDSQTLQKVPKNEFKTFVFSSIITVMVGKYLVERFTRQFVKDIPFSETIIHIIENNKLNSTGFTKPKSKRFIRVFWNFVVFTLRLSLTFYSKFIKWLLVFNINMRYVWSIIITY